jgi:predicted pyridoxine 5'-phosphate oxidase superfamily flavin-nucleotide-binding protein
MRSPFHAGERAMQTRAGVREVMEPIGQRVFRDYMPDQHRTFFEQLPLLFLGLLDEHRRPWATVVTGAPGFVRSPDPRSLHIGALPVAGDPARPLILANAPIGILGIQPHTRRRNRANGTVVRADDAGLEVRVDQSFGNCPKYIQAREPEVVGEARSSVAQLEGSRIGAEAEAIVREADTFFIASASQLAAAGDSVEGADVSHRGGKPGFVRVHHDERGTTLAWPDFIGNNFFNTLGNLALHPFAGLLFVDFAGGTLLSLACEDAEIDWDGAEVAGFTGAERVVRARVSHGVLIRNVLPLRWSAPQQAKELARTGAWSSE